jgi:hypothetical protein
VTYSARLKVQIASVQATLEVFHSSLTMWLLGQDILESAYYGLVWPPRIEQLDKNIMIVKLGMSLKT